MYITDEQWYYGIVGYTTYGESLSLQDFIMMYGKKRVRKQFGFKKKQKEKLQSFIEMNTQQIIDLETNLKKLLPVDTDPYKFLAEFYFAVLSSDLMVIG